MMNKYLSAVILMLSIVAGLCEQKTDITINDIKNALPKGIDLPTEFQNITLPTGDDVKQVFKDKCNKASGSDAAYDEASQAATVFYDCMQGMVNISTIQQEIEEAKPNGNLDVVFSKYCKKRNRALDCLGNFTASLEPCLTKEEVTQKKTVMDVAHNLLEFMCINEGNQMALFIAEAGPECFQDKSESIQKCFEKTYNKYSHHLNDTSSFSIDNLPELVLTDENCKDITTLQKCVVTELESCSTPTPSNIVESLIKYALKETPCAKYTKASEKSSSDIHKLSLNVLIGTWGMALFAKFLLSYQ